MKRDDWDPQYGDAPSHRGGASSEYPPVTTPWRSSPPEAPPQPAGIYVRTALDIINLLNNRATPSARLAVLKGMREHILENLVALLDDVETGDLLPFLKNRRSGISRHAVELLGNAKIERLMPLFEARAADISAGLTEDSRESATQLAECVQTLRSVQIERVSLNAQQSELEIEKSESASEAAAVNSLKCELEKIKTRISALKTKNEALEKQNTKAEEWIRSKEPETRAYAERLQVETGKLAELERGLRSEEGRLKASKQSTATALASINLEIANLEKETATVQSDLASRQRELQQLNTKVEASTIGYKTAEKTLGDLRSNITRCNGEIAAETSLLESKQAEVGRLKSTNQTLVEELESIGVTKVELEGRVSAAKDALNPLRVEIAALQKEIEQLGVGIDQSQAKKTELDSLNELYSSLIKFVEINFSSASFLKSSLSMGKTARKDHPIWKYLEELKNSGSFLFARTDTGREHFFAKFGSEMAEIKKNGPLISFLSNLISVDFFKEEVAVAVSSAAASSTETKPHVWHYQKF